MHRLYVCQTCRRDEPIASGTRSRGARLTDAVVDALVLAGLDARLTLVRVACLNGCLNACNAALRAPRKYGLRFSRLDEEDAPALVELARAYLDDPDGDPSAGGWAGGLVDRISARVPPPHRLIE